MSEKTILNSGGFIRRRSDEFNYEPSIGMLMQRKDGTVHVVRHFLNISKDKFNDIEHKDEDLVIDISDFLEKLESLGEHGLDFVEAVKRTLLEEKIEPAVKEIINDIINDMIERNE